MRVPLPLIRNLTPPDTDHEGVGQEVFLAAFRSLASFDPKRSAFSAWLFTIAGNRCRTELARRRPVVGAELPDVVDLWSPTRAASEAGAVRAIAARSASWPLVTECQTPTFRKRRPRALYVLELTGGLGFVRNERATGSWI
jgi:DNA-directed RNA polymerase specialized sigma24 family protein